jgi:acyl-homoserine-lactone acylase
VTLYRSEYGPMLYLGNSLFDWTSEHAFTYRDANAENLRLFRHYFRWNTAKSLDEFKQIHREEVAVPWANTTAVDRAGDAYYGDLTVVPNVPDQLAIDCKVGLRSTALSQAAPGLPLLDGSKAACDWVIDPEAPQPGAFAAASLPSVERRDYVVNCNDSFWLTNPSAPLTGFARIIGRQDYEQTLRSRLCHQLVLDRLADADQPKFTVENVKAMTVASRVYSAERFRDEAIAALCADDAITLTEDPLTGGAVDPAVEVDVTDACAALAAWDTRNDPESKGSLLWDELWFRVQALRSSVVVFETPFSAADPLNTPSTLKTREPRLAQAFAAAVRSVAAAGFAVDAPRSEIAYYLGKGGERIAVPGGFQSTGNFTIAQVARRPALAADVAYGPTNNGNSYIQVVGFTESGVAASTFVTYSQSTDPASPHFDDYTRLYSQKQWLAAAFTEEEVAADTKSTVLLAQ